jgi:hypothetical protein
MVRSGIAQLLSQVETTLEEYDHSFDELFVSAVGPQRFVRFLGNAHDHFRTCGAGIGLLQHVYELWDRSTRPFPQRHTNGDSLTQVLSATSDILSAG